MLCRYINDDNKEWCKEFVETMVKMELEKLKMKWNETIGCKGRAHVTKTQGSKNDGVYFNNVGRFIDPVAKAKESKSEVDDEWS